MNNKKEKTDFSESLYSTLDWSDLDNIHISGYKMSEMPHDLIKTDYSTEYNPPYMDKGSLFMLINANKKFSVYPKYLDLEMEEIPLDKYKI